MGLDDLIQKARVAGPMLPRIPSVALNILRSRLNGDGDAQVVLEWILSENGGVLAPIEHSTKQQASSADLSETAQQAGTPPPAGTIRLYGWALSYFSGKVRGYLRYKARVTPGFSFDEVVATPEIIKKVLVPVTHTRVVPQVQIPGQGFVQDSTEIIDAVEALLLGSPPVLPSAAERPRQRLACELLELLGDEWLLTPAFHWRWAYSGDGTEAQRMPAFMNGAQPLPNHRVYNEAQWGTFLRPDGSEMEQRRAGQFLFNNFILGGVSGIKSSMGSLGVTEETVAAWEASARNILRILDGHFKDHDFILGGKPSTADFGLLGPLYAHLYADPVPGKMMRDEFPHVATWCERVHDRGGLAERGSEQWFEDDHLPDAVMELLQVFFTEFWPVLDSTCRVLTSYLQSGKGPLLPGKSFGPDSADQHGTGPLTHAFELPFDAQGRPGGVSKGRRLVVPYQVWMLQRLAAAMGECNDAVMRDFLGRLNGGKDLLQLPSLLSGCRVRKDGGLLYAVNDVTVARSKL